MKIGFVLDDGLDKPDGVQQYIRTLGNWYEKQGHEVRYLVGETKRTDIQHVYSLAKNVKVRFNGNALSIPLPASRRKIRAVLEQEQFDVIHVQVPYSPFMGAKVISQVAPGVMVIGTFHILPYGWLSSVGTRLLGLWLRFNMKRFNNMVSVSAPAAAFARTHFGVDSQIVPNSVDMTVYKPHKPVEKDTAQLRLLFLGRLVERKGCRQLLRALAILHAHNQLPTNVHVDICGDGPQRQSLERYVRDKNMSDFVSFHGFVSLEQKVTFMQKADISIFPSLSGESFGIVLIEAMAAAGGVVLAGNNPGYASVLGEVPESIVEPRNTQKMADQIHRIMANEDIRNELYAQQQVHVHQFDTEVVGRQLIELYRNPQS